MSWTDLIQGTQEFLPEQLGGDFIIKRRDGLFSYQLAVAIDDSVQEITHVIRGADLLESTARQLHLQRLMGLRQPDYGHLPVVTDQTGTKLSKQFHAPSIDTHTPEQNLLTALGLLGQKPAIELADANCEEILGWGVENWRLASVTKTLPFGYEHS